MKAITSDLRSLPGVGKAIAEDLREIGVNTPADLVGRSADDLYAQVCARQGYIDRCLLYTFRCAIYVASTPDPDPGLVQWWKWKDGSGPHVPVAEPWKGRR